MRLFAITLAALACGGILRPDPLPTKRPAAPYLCAINTGGAGQITIYTNINNGALMRVTSGTECRSLPRLQEVYIGFAPNSGLWSRRIYWTPIPLRPAAESIECYFVDASNPQIAIGAIRPCYEGS